MTLPQISRPVRPRLAHWAFLLLMVWVAFSLRLYRLDAQELWGDESVSVGSRRLSEAQVLLGKTDVHPPLYFFTLREAMLPFGASLFAIRFVSAFWGVLVVPLVYRIGKRAMSGRVGALAALFAAVSALQVFYSQEARMYTMATAWAAASLWCTVELLRSPRSSPPRRRGAFKYVFYFLNKASKSPRSKVSFFNNASTILSSWCLCLVRMFLAVF